MLCYVLYITEASSKFLGEHRDGVGFCEILVLLLTVYECLLEIKDWIIQVLGG